ncbi:MAG: tryptophan--tRNA ligase [Bacilli bacterium]
MKRLLTAIKPTGDLTLGNYIGAIKPILKMQDEYEMYMFVANLHAITISNNPEELNIKTKKVAATYLACGIDPIKTNIFIQSENLYHANLSWILECGTYIGELNRMTQYKDKSKKLNDSSITCGLYTYPVLMASDILLYDTDVVPVGEDQRQHVELARNIAIRFNGKYGATFKVPEVVVPKQGARIKNLQDPTKKMNKSDSDTIAKGSILLLDDVNVARKKIMGAVTDSQMVVKYDVVNKPGISNLMTIYSCLEGKNFDEIEKEFDGKNYGAFKVAVANSVVKFLTDFQTKFNKIMNSKELDNILDKGLKKAILISKPKYEAVVRKVGFMRCER